jgi:hypothetical protein
VKVKAFEWAMTRPSTVASYGSPIRVSVEMVDFQEHTAGGKLKTVGRRYAALLPIDLVETIRR